MFKNEYLLSVDIKKQMSAVVPTFVQYDNATLLFKIYDDSRPFDFTGFTKASLSHKRPDGTIVVGTGEIETLSNGEKAIRYTYQGNEMNQVGFVSTSLTLHSSDKKVSIQSFKVEITSDMTEEAIGAAPEAGVLQQLIATVSETITQIDGIIESAAEVVEVANNATNIANNALNLANQAIINANTAANNANTKASIAETATNNANTKADLASEKAQAAEVAAIDAIKAVQDVQIVTNNANQAIINTNAALDDLSDAIITANEIIDDANSATVNVMAIADSWKYINTHDMNTHYIKNNIVTYNGSSYIAIKDNISVVPVGDASDTNWKLVALKGDDGHLVLYREVFDGIAGQTIFTLSNNYDPLQNRVHIDIGGVLQYSPMHFMETSSNSITLNYPLERNMKVIVTYFGEAPALTNSLQLQIDELNEIVQLFNLVEVINTGNDAQAQADYAQAQAHYAKDQGDYAKTQGDFAKTQGEQTRAAILNANNVANDAIAIKDEMLSTLIDAQNITQHTINAGNNAQSLIDNLSVMGSFELTAEYKKNNIVLNNGTSWIALMDTQHNPLPILPIIENQWWHLVAQRGTDGQGAVSSVNGISPDINGNITLNTFAGTVVKVDGTLADVNGEVVTHTNKSVLDALSNNAGKLSFNGQLVAPVTSVNGNTGAITGLETVTNSNTKLENKVDKIAGKQLSTEDFTTTEKTKLNGIAANANNYIHPASHPASIITQDSSNRFVTDAEKEIWNAKPSTNIATSTINGLMSSSDKTKLNSIESGAQVNTVLSVNGETGAIAGLETTTSVDSKLMSKVDKIAGKQLSTEDFTTTEKTKLNNIATGANNYIHPTSHPASIIEQNASNRFVTDTEKKTWNEKANNTIVTTTTAGLMSSTDKAKLNGITTNAEVNQNAFSNIVVGDTTISANFKTDTIAFEAGNNVILTPDTTDKKITISFTDANVAYGLATTTTDGLMASSDKVKLNNIATGANNYIHPTSHPASIITQDSSNRFVTDAEKKTWNEKANNTIATTSVNGLMSSSDKTKLNGIESGAQVNTVLSVNGNIGEITGLATKTEVNTLRGELTTHASNALSHIPYAATTGSANVYAVTLPEVLSYTEGMALAVKINVANTGASTININNLGAKAIVKGNGNSVTSGNLKINSIYTLRYNGTSFIVQGEGGEYGTASSDQVLSGYTIGTDSGLVSGTIVYRGAGGTVTPSTTEQTKYAGYYTSNITISGDSNLVASNIKSGTRIFGVTGSFVGNYGTATSSQVLSGYTIGTNSGLVSGTITNRSSNSTSPATGTRRTSGNGYIDLSPDVGYYSGASESRVRITDANFIPSNILQGVSLFGLTGTGGAKFAVGNGTLYISGQSPNYLRDINYTFNAGFPPKAFAFMISRITTNYESYWNGIFLYFPEGNGASGYVIQGTIINNNTSILRAHQSNSLGQVSFVSGNYVYIQSGISSSYYIDSQTVPITVFAWG